MADPSGTLPSFLGSPGSGMSADPAITSFRARSFLESPRVRDLSGRASHYDGTNHDWKSFDFDGRLVAAGGSTPDVLSAEPASWAVPLRQRRPCMPERIGRLVVDAFTTLIIGNNRGPTLRVHGDADAQMFGRALVRDSNLQVLMTQARNIGGACGTVGLSWRYWQGRPRVRVHEGRNLFVHRWADRESFLPAHATEIYLFPRERFDPFKREWQQAWYWHRRDWTETADIVFQDVPYDGDLDPDWSGHVDQEASVDHRDGFCHLVWIRNLPGADPACPDGVPDYDGVYDRLDTIDLLSSVIARGGICNLDPTLVLNMDPNLVAAGGVAKGSDNSLSVGTDGSASYLELAGSSISTGNDMLDRFILRTLRILQCVLADPDKAVAAGTSSLTLKAVYMPMIGKADLIRAQYGEGMGRLLAQMFQVARRWRDEVEIVVDEAGSEVDRYERAILLEESVAGEGGGSRIVPCVPGSSTRIDLAWGDYFPPTPTDQQAAVTTVTQAKMAGVMSLESAVEIVAGIYHLDPAVELGRLQAAAQKAASMVSDATPPIGGGVPSPTGLPPGAAPRIARPPQIPRVPKPPPPIES